MDELVIVRAFFEALKEFMLKERKRLNPWWRKFFLLKPVCPHINEILNWIDTYIDTIHFKYYCLKYNSLGMKNFDSNAEELNGWMNEARECLDLLILCKRVGMFIS